MQAFLDQYGLDSSVGLRRHFRPVGFPAEMLTPDRSPEQELEEGACDIHIPMFCLR
jgi:hypothetical protein